MSKWGSVTKNILNALETLGPMTRMELCNHLQIDRGIGAAVANRLTKSSPKASKRVYIKTYVYDHEGQRRYPRAVYAIGDKPDAKKPKSDAVENKKRYINAKLTKHRTNSVFNLGLTKKQIENIVGAKI